ncbi:hypothetical protein U5801_11625 [Lamprobacter modestohalophilus]|nr:hypothetical protein [Lamprobacter modestohalophilus]MEA1050454.1 hypothetical protein [Lamprobacter modestohalophilus]
MTPEETAGILVHTFAPAALGVDYLSMDHLGLRERRQFKRIRHQESVSTELPAIASTSSRGRHQSLPPSLVGRRRTGALSLGPDQGYTIELGTLNGMTPSTQRQIQLVAIHRRIEATIGCARPQIEALNRRTGRSGIVAPEIDPHLAHPITLILGSQLAPGSYLKIIIRAESRT